MAASPLNSSCLCIFAHPDDEVFRCGGTLALLAKSGVRVWILSLTSGQAGSCGTLPICTPEELGEVRKQELRCSCKTLGLEKPIILDYSDGALENASQAEMENLIQEYAEGIHPQIMITWPLDGLSGHPDHSTVSACTTQVFTRMMRVANEYLKSLYYLAVPKSIAAALGMNSLSALPDETISVEMDVRTVLDRKMAAIECHRTQLDGSPILKRDHEARELFLGKEHFIRAREDSSSDVLIDLCQSMGEQ